MICRILALELPSSAAIVDVRELGRLPLPTRSGEGNPEPFKLLV